MIVSPGFSTMTVSTIFSGVAGAGWQAVNKAPTSMTTSMRIESFFMGSPPIRE